MQNAVVSKSNNLYILVTMSVNVLQSYLIFYSLLKLLETNVTYCTLFNTWTNTRKERKERDVLRLSFYKIQELFSNCSCVLSRNILIIMTQRINYSWKNLSFLLNWYFYKGDPCQLIKSIFTDSDITNNISQYIMI